MQQLSFFNSDEGLEFPQGMLEYTPHFLSAKESDALLGELITEVPWQQQTIKMYGKTMNTPRLVAWYGDSRAGYKFSGTKFDPIPWTPGLFALKQRVEAHTRLSFNSVLLNFYRNGNDSVAWHSDDEADLGPNPHIASLSIGQSRRFEFRNRQDHSKKYALELANGSLLLMKAGLQSGWQHQVPKSKKDTGQRINLTFRSIVYQ